MTYQLDVARSRKLVARWCMLAEQRLEYLTELFETGRWRRYHSELAFLENIQEAKAAVENWRKLSVSAASGDYAPVEISWPTHKTASLLPKLMATDIPTEPSADTPLVPETRFASSESEEASVRITTQEGAELTLDVAAIAQRYPLLRNEL
jgi:uncharacterized repeat protein (TIGR03809 family)